MLPRRRGIMSRHAACVQCTVPMRFVSRTVRQPSSGWVASKPSRMTPAELTSTSRRPCARRTSAMSAVTACRSRTSNLAAVARPPRSTILRVVSAAAVSFDQYPTTTYPPSAASVEATAAPMPRLPPVTTQTRSLGVVALTGGPLTKRPSEVHETPSHAPGPTGNRASPVGCRGRDRSLYPVPRPPRWAAAHPMIEFALP